MMKYDLGLAVCKVEDGARASEDVRRSCREGVKEEVVDGWGEAACEISSGRW